MNLRSKLISRIIPLVMGTSLCIGIFVYGYLYHEYERIMVNESSILLRQIQSSIDNYSDNIEKQIITIAKDDAVQELLSPAPKDESVKNAGRYLNSLKEQYPSFLEIYVVDDKANLLSMKGNESIYWHKLLVQKMEQTKSRSMRMPMFLDNKLMPTYTQKIDSLGLTFKKSGYVIILDDYSYFDKLLSKAAGFENNFIFIANKYEVLRNPNAYPGAEEFIRNASEDSFFMIKYGISRFDNKEYFYYMVPLEKGNSIIGFTPTSAFRTTAKSRGIVIIAISFLLSVGISMFLVSFINRIVVTPIKKIDYLTKEMAKENFSVKLAELETTDEIGNLYKSFMDMNESLSGSLHRINELAHYDDLTRLPNRRSLNSILKEYISFADNTNTKVSVFMMDVDDFKEVNDLFGHHIGDELLIEISNRMVICANEIANKFQGIDVKVCRLAGDEFTIIVGKYTDDLIITSLANNIIDSFKSPLVLKNNKFKVSITLGVSSFPKDGDDRHLLLKYADMAMYEAKQSGKNCFTEFTDEMKDRLKDRKELERKIIYAIDHDEFTLHYQPKVSTLDGSVNEFEALIRWQHPEDGFISPAKFIPFAEENGLIDRIGVWVFEQVCKDIVVLRNRGWIDFKLSFNTSPQQLQNTAYTNGIKETVQRLSIDPRNLEMEITEYSLAKDISEAVKHLNTIKSLGISIAIDDFGTGYSSLSYLEKLPIDVLKIDRSFISKAKDNKAKLTIIATIVTLAKGLGLKTVAEGVETSDENLIASNYGCDFIQGYYFYKPMKLEDLDVFAKYCKKIV